MRDIFWLRFYTARMYFLPHLAALIRWDKPAGSWLLLWPAWWGYAATMPETHDPLALALLALGALVMRSAGCAINDMTDSKLDAHVERTATRPLASGALTLWQAGLFLGLLLLMALGICLALSPCLLWLALPSLALVIAYPWMKRITWWPQVFLGITFNMGVWFGWFASSGEPSIIPVLLYLAGVSWTIGYDTIYAHQDMRDDAIIGIKSTALLWGKHRQLGISLCYILCVLCLAAVAFLLQSVVFGAFVGLFALQLGWQLCRYHTHADTQAAALFLSNQWAGGIIFTGLVAAAW